jgi:hypothetical protein
MKQKKSVEVNNSRTVKLNGAYECMLNLSRCKTTRREYRPKVHFQDLHLSCPSHTSFFFKKERKNYLIPLYLKRCSKTS